MSRLAYFGTLLAFAGAFTAASSQAKEWPLKYELGTEFVRHGDTVTLSVGADLITVRNIHAVVLFAIPPAAVGELDRDVDGTSLFIGVSWQDDIGKRRAMLQGGNKESAGLVRELEKATGRQCQDRLMAEERSAERTDVYSRARLVTYEPARPAGQQEAGAQEKAFCFPVRRARGLSGFCNGVLRVTRDRIAFDPVYSPECRGYGFDLPRGDMRAVGSANSPGQELKIAGKSYNFCSLFFRPLVGASPEKEQEFWSLFGRVVVRFDEMADRYRVMNPQPRFRELPKGKVWYAEGRGTGELRITASEGQLWIEGGPSAILSVPYPSITDVVYETYRLTRDASNAALACLMGWGGLATYAAILVLNQLIPERERYVHIFWNLADGDEGITSFKIEPRQAATLLTELAGRIAIPTMVPDVRLEHRLCRIEKEKQNSQYVFVHENAVPPEVTSMPLCDIYWFQRYPARSGRQYQILLLREDNQRGVIVLFEGDEVRSERAVALVPVTISPLPETDLSAAEGPRRVQAQADCCRITEIRTGSEILRLPPAPPLRQVMPFVLPHFLPVCWGF